MGQIFPHSIDGGLNLEAGPSAPHLVTQTGTISVPWLTVCENAVFDADGWPKKMPGASNVNSSATGATDHVNGIFDYWRSGTGSSTSQQRLLYAGTAIYRESGGTLTSIKTGLEAQKMPWFEVMNDEVVISTSSSTDVPMVWDQTTFANLGGSPPNFDFAAEYKDRMFAAGVDSNKSRLYYTVSANHEDWTGSGSGSIDVAPDDGDVITGLRKHKDRLIIFKGPNVNSIYYLSGSSPTGDDAFALHPFVKGVGATNNQAIVLVRDDLVFWDDNGIHSLATTEAFGDYASAFISAPILSYVIKRLNHNRFDMIWGANFRAAGYALWTVSKAGSTTHDQIIMWDYRFNPARFAFWPAYSVASIAMVRDSSRETVPWAGTYTGRAMRMNQSSQNIASTAYTYKMAWPSLSYGDPFFDKVFSGFRIGIAPKGETTATVAWTRDGNTQQSASISQGGVATLAPSDDQFALDSDVLGGGRFVSRFDNSAQGQFKEIQFEFTKSGASEDFEPHSFAADIEIGGIGYVEPVG